MCYGAKKSLGKVRRRNKLLELVTRDKTNLDITWIKDKDDLEDVTLADLMSTISEKSTNITKAVEQLNSLLSGIEE